MKTETAIFAAGCFWHIEDSFSKIKGVISTRVGYIGGKVKNPNYKNVCSGTTGHMEATEVTFNPEKISYEKLLDIFWKIHNPTTLNQQGFDFGKQYNSVIFYNNLKQKNLAEESKKERQRDFRNKIVTKVIKSKKFWPAEEYHQKYYKKQKGKIFNLK